MMQRRTYRQRTVLLAVFCTCIASFWQTLSAKAEDWRQWGGPDGDWGRARTVLAERWGEDGPPRLWRRPLGVGYSGLVTAGGAVYTMYREGEEEIVVSLDGATGNNRWQHRYATRTYERNVLQFGQGPNATPLVAGDLLVTIGYAGNLFALERDTGAVAWSHNLIEDLSGKIQRFGYSVSPLLYDGAVVVAVGGEKGLIAFEPADGSIRWESEPVDISYSTPRVISVGGQDQIVLLSATEALGLKPGPGGAVQWRYPFRNGYTNNASEILWDGESRLFIVTQADVGARMLRLVSEAGKTRVEEQWKNPKVNMHFWPAAWLGDRIYASIGGQGSILATVDAKDGEILSRQRDFDRVKWLRAGDHLLLLDGSGKLRIARPSGEGLTVLAETQLLEADAWTAPILAGTRLYARDKKSIVAVELAPPVSSRSHSREQALGG